MSKLIEGLERIEVWLKINMPKRASELRPDFHTMILKNKLMTCSLTYRKRFMNCMDGIMEI
ncbi:hypothetical protein CAL7102_05466 [Dulcicalothrix desertica PCC 7102]|nr:hypothetical protein CAL7102_05466 [Dulcicalothrix desertica PCC 7102]